MDTALLQTAKRKVPTKSKGATQLAKSLQNGVRFILVIFAASLLSACNHYPSSATYAELYIRALDSDGYSDVGAKIYRGDSGQVLTTESTPTAVQLKRRDGWYPGQIAFLVLDAPGYRAAVHAVKIDRWARSPQEATLNANNVDVLMVRDR